MTLLTGLTTERTLFFLPAGVTAGQVLCHRDPSGCCGSQVEVCAGVALPADLFVTVIAEGAECACLQATFHLQYAGGVWSSPLEFLCGSSIEWRATNSGGHLQVLGLAGGAAFFAGEAVPSAPVYLHWVGSLPSPCSGSVNVYLVE